MTAKVAIYARVSTASQVASLDTQITQCRKAAEMRGFEIVMEIREIASGAAKKLPERQRLLKAANMGNFNTLIVARLDRFGRSILDLFNMWMELQAINVNFISIEDGIDFSTPTGQLQAGLFAVFADFERKLILNPTSEGREAAKAKGVKFGRKQKVTEEIETEIVQLLKMGHTQKSLADKFKLDRGLIYRIRRKHLPISTRKSPQNPAETNPNYEYSK